MNPAQLPEELFGLIKSKPFEALLPIERALVLQWISAEEYEEMHEQISVFLEMDQSLEGKFQQSSPYREPKKQAIRKVLLYPIPAYQVAALLLLLGSFYFFRPKQQAPTQPDRIQVKKQGKSIDEDQYPDSLVFNL